jgi:hypothetical protein
MDYSTGKLSFIFLVAVALSAMAAWWLAHRYRVAMRRLMSAPAADAVGVAPPLPRSAARPPPAPLAVADNRRAGWRLALLLAGMSLLMSISSAWLELAFVIGQGTTSANRLMVLSFIHLWPLIPALGLLWRWSRPRVVGVLLLWFVACVLFMLWRSNDQQAVGPVLGYLALEIGPPMLLLSLLCLGNATRAIAPWLLPPMLGLVWASIAGVDLLWWLVAHRSPWLASLPTWLGARTVMVLFAAAPWLVAWWPLRRLGRALGAAYARKRLSELMVLFTAVWGVTQLYPSFGAASDLGLAGAVMLLPLAWIPLVMAIVRRASRPAGRPPTLLVLRVFQHDRQVQALFDEVLERWRLSGNTVLIAGTDLVERTIDADDIFTFLDGRLAARFIRAPADVAARLGAFDMERDADGRFRINECYCHDSTWREALAALVDRSDVALMDLRGFQARHAGCRHELGVLARAPALARVVVLTDGDTDMAQAKAAAEGAPPARFVWLDISRIDRRKRRDSLASLFAFAAPTAR